MDRSSSEADLDTTEIYRATRCRITELARADGADGRAVVPACPHWTVADLLAHLTGICADVMAGNMAGAATDAWTDEQVAARRGRSLGEILDEWDDLGPRVEALVGPGGAPAQFIFDTVTHEHDLRHALDRPGVRDGPAMLVASEFIVGGFDEAVRALDLPPFRIVTGLMDQVIGGGTGSGVELRTSPFEAMRAMSGRRSAGEFAALDWGGSDPSPWVPALTWGPFTVRESSLEE